MTIGLTYDDTLSRVQIALSDLPDGTVQVQRVANAAATEALWARGVVRGGSVLPIVGGVGNLDDFEFFADVANHYRVVPVDPPAGLLLTGTSGDYASTPDDPALDITGDIDLRGLVIPRDLSAVGPSGNGVVLAKYDTVANQRSYRLSLVNDGFISINWSTDGAMFESHTATVPVPFATGDTFAIRATLNVDGSGTDYRVHFYAAPTLAELNTADPLEIVNGTGVTSVFSSTAELAIGSHSGGAGNSFDGLILAVEVYSGFSGDIRANPDFSAQSHGTTSFTDSAGRPWTVNGNAQIVGTETASITPSLEGRVWLKSIRYPALNRPLPRLLDRGQDIRRTGRDATMLIAGRTTPVGATEHRTAPTFTIHVKTSDVDQAGELDIILAAGGVFFVHVPATSKLPGGYVLFVGDTAQQQSTVADDFMFVLPCQVVAPPAPQVTGTLLTAETIFRLYGDANALFAAHSTGRSLLATIADPSDVVVV